MLLLLLLIDLLKTAHAVKSAWMSCLVIVHPILVSMHADNLLKSFHLAQHTI